MSVYLVAIQSIKKNEAKIVNLINNQRMFNVVTDDLA